MVLILAGSLPACSLFRGACQAAMPAVTVAQSYAADAAMSLEQAVALVALSGLPQETKAQILSGIERARTSLKQAETLVRAAASACTQPDLVSIFRDFVQAWSVIAPLLAQAENRLGGSAGAQPSMVPAIVLEASRVK